MKRPTEDDLKKARAYGLLRDHLKERALKRLKALYGDRAKPFSMIALMQAAWERATEEGLEELFFITLNSLTGASVQRLVQTEEGQAANVNVQHEPGAAEIRDGGPTEEEGGTRH